MLAVIAAVILALVDNANILLTAPCPGSHYFTMLQLGKLLADNGHNVTLVTPFDDNRLISNSNIEIKVSAEHSYSMDTFTSNTAEPCVRSLFKLRSGKTMYIDTMFSSICTKAWLWLYKSNIDLYTSDWFVEILSNGNFDAIIAEEKTFLPVATVNQKLKIPVAVYISEIGVYLIRQPLNLPQLMNSEPGIFVQVFRGKAPTFWERLTALYKVYTGAPAIHSGIDNMLHPKMSQFNVTSTHELYKQISLYFVNDYIAFSFPYLYPNNVIQSAALLAHKTKNLQEDILAFIEMQKSPILYVSLGSYVNWHWIPWFNDFIDALKFMDVGVIMKMSHDFKNDLFNDRFYVQKWLPQNDILASGYISIFVSHCGNNGRIESILNEVPILCLPIFAEQNLNGELVSRNNFGHMLLPDEITKVSLISVLEEMIGNQTVYKTSIRKALDIFHSEPATVGEKVLHGVNLLTKYGNMKHLINEIIQEQSVIEIYNFDIIFALFGLVLSFLVIFYKVLKSLVTTIKHKQE